MSKSRSRSKHDTGCMYVFVHACLCVCVCVRAHFHTMRVMHRTRHDAHAVARHPATATASLHSRLGLNPAGRLTQARGRIEHSMTLAASA